MSVPTSPLLFTPDARYLVIRGRLWRASNPHLSPDDLTTYRKELMHARRDVSTALRSKNTAALKDARTRVQHYKVKLGERGPVWWTDDAPDYNRHLVKNTPYADWYLQQPAAIK